MPHSSRYYRQAGLIWLDACLLFALINGVQVAVEYAADVWTRVNPASDRGNPVSEKYGYSQVAKNYPGMKRRELNDLLRETWSRPYAYEPFTHFKERPSAGRYVNVDAHGFRRTKNQGPWPPDPGSYNVFLFGGSTAFNYGLPDDLTIASVLQETLNRTRVSGPVRVYNFARGQYYSTQERILFEKLLVAGFVPDVAIFVDGLNEFHAATDEPHLSGRFAQLFEKMVQATPEETLNLAQELFGRLPVARALASSPEMGLGKPEVTAPPGLGEGEREKEEDYNDEPLLTSQIERYGRNKRIIEAVARAYRVDPVFVWQAVPTYAYEAEWAVRGNFGTHTFSKFGYRRMAELWKRGALGDHFLWCAEIHRGLREPLYVDAVHYSAETSRAMARCIVDYIRTTGLLTKRHDKGPSTSSLH